MMILLRSWKSPRKRNECFLAEGCTTVASIPSHTIPCYVPHWRGGAISYHTISYHILYHTISYQTIPYHSGKHTFPYHTMPCTTLAKRCNIIPHYTTPHHCIPCHVPQWRGGAIPCHSIPHHTIAYHAMHHSDEEVPYHTTPYLLYHIIPCYTTSCRTVARRRPGKFTSFLTIWIFHSSSRILHLKSSAFLLLSF